MEGYSICLNIIWLSLLDLNKITRIHKDCKSFFVELCHDVRMGDDGTSSPSPRQTRRGPG